MTAAERAADYQLAGAELDQHLRDCPLCSTGRGCPTGDDAAEAEYRAWRRLDTTRGSTSTRRRWSA
jgi:hypothetical protein